MFEEQEPNVLNSSATPYPPDVGWTVGPSDIITPNAGSNGIPGVDVSSDIIDIDARALRFETLSDDILTLNTRKSIPDRAPSIDPITGQTRAIGRSALSIFFDEAGNSTSSARNLGTFTGRQQYSDSVSSSDTNDYYRLYLDAPAEKLEIGLRGLTSDADVQFLNSSNRVLASSTNSGSRDEYARIDNLNSGTYYVRVYRFSGDTNYDLTLNLDQAGNSRSDARDLGTLTDRSALGDYEFSDFVGSNLGDSADYYEFQLDRPRQLSFALRGLSGNANVYLEDRNGTVLQSGTNSGTRDELKDYNLAANTTYYMRVASVGSDFTNYNLVLNPGNEVGSSSSGQVDLSPAYFDVVREPLNAGDSFDARWRVRNGGSGNAGSFRVGFYLSTNSTISTSDRLLGFSNFSSLAAGSTSNTVTGQLTLPSASDSFWRGSRNYYIGMLVDDLRAVGETSESNNTRYDGVDIEIQSSSAPSDQAGNSTSSARNLGTFTGRQQYSDFVGSADTNDYYRLYLDAPAEKLEIGLRGLTSNADVQLLNSSNRVLASSTNSNSQNEYARIDNLNSGTYYVRVYRRSGDTDYDLTLNLDQAGNNRSDARDLGTLTDRSALGDYEFSDFVGSNLGDSADYYKFQLDRSRQLSFALRGLTGNANVYLEDANGNVLQSGTNSGTMDELKDYNLAANTPYYMRVDPVGSDATNYTLVLNPGNEVSGSPQQFSEEEYMERLYGHSGNTWTRGIIGSHQGLDTSDRIWPYEVHALVGGEVIAAKPGVQLTGVRANQNAGYLNGVRVVPASQYNATVTIWNPDIQRRFTYLHFSEVFVSEGQEVNPGDVIGIEGSTGWSTGRHSHVEVRTSQGLVEDPRDTLGQARWEGILEKNYR